MTDAVSSFQFEIEITEHKIASDKNSWLVVVAHKMQWPGEGSLLRRVRVLGACIVNGWLSEVPTIQYLSIEKKEDRGKGIGTEMIEQVIARCRKANKRAVSVIRPNRIRSSRVRLSSPPHREQEESAGRGVVPETRLRAVQRRRGVSVDGVSDPQAELIDTVGKPTRRGAGDRDKQDGQGCNEEK